MKRIVMLGLLVVACLFAVYVWPTRYRYDRAPMGKGLFAMARINRFSGEVETLRIDGWKRHAPRVTFPSPDELLGKRMSTVVRAEDYDPKPPTRGQVTVALATVTLKNAPTTEDLDTLAFFDQYLPYQLRMLADLQERPPKK